MFTCRQKRPENEVAPEAQLVLTASWLTMKETALLAGALARALPMPSECPVPPSLRVRRGMKPVSMLHVQPQNAATLLVDDEGGGAAARHPHSRLTNTR